MFEAPLVRTFVPYLDQKHLSTDEARDFDDLYVWSERGSGIEVSIGRVYCMDNQDEPIEFSVYLGTELPKYEIPKRATKLFFRGGWLTSYRVEFDVLEREWRDAPYNTEFYGEECWWLRLKSNRPHRTVVDRE